jgi:hypothetical protein
MHKKLLTVQFFLAALSLFFLSPQSLRAQGSNFKDLVGQVEEGKTYALIKVKAGTAKAYDEKEGYQILLVPPVYRTYLDTIVLSPALNGNLDTSNYFIHTEVLVLREFGAQWHTVSVSRLCMTDATTPPQAAVCLLKTTPKYEMVNIKFYPFKNITDTSRTDNVIPADLKIVQREVLVTPARLEKIGYSEVPPAGVKSIKVSVGSWSPWQEVVCPYGVFNDPNIQQVQLALQKRGYDLKITNNYDEQTKRALHQFQNDNVLTPSDLDAPTLKRLGMERIELIQIED